MIKPCFVLAHFIILFTHLVYGDGAQEQEFISSQKSIIHDIISEQPILFIDLPSLRCLINANQCYNQDSNRCEEISIGVGEGGECLKIGKQSEQTRIDRLNKNFCFNKLTRIIHRKVSPQNNTRRQQFQKIDVLNEIQKKEQVSKIEIQEQIWKYLVKQSEARKEIKINSDNENQRDLKQEYDKCEIENENIELEDDENQVNLEIGIQNEQPFDTFKKKQFNQNDESLDNFKIKQLRTTPHSQQLSKTIEQTHIKKFQINDFENIIKIPQQCPPQQCMKDTCIDMDPFINPFKLLNNSDCTSSYNYKHSECHHQSYCLDMKDEKCMSRQKGYSKSRINCLCDNENECIFKDNNYQCVKIQRNTLNIIGINQDGYCLLVDQIDSQDQIGRIKSLDQGFCRFKEMIIKLSSNMIVSHSLNCECLPYFCFSVNKCIPQKQQNEILLKNDNGECIQQEQKRFLQVGAIWPLQSKEIQTNCLSNNSNDPVNPFQFCSYCTKLKCLKCIQGYFLFQGNCILCPQGIDDTSSGTFILSSYCYDCLIQKETWQIFTTSCLNNFFIKCQGIYQLNNNSILWVDQLNDNKKYYSISNDNSQSNEVLTALCSLTDCISCINNRCMKCQVGKYIEQQYFTCQGCISNCNQCLDSSTCKICANNFYLSRSLTCVQCQPNCELCETSAQKDIKQPQCTKCATGYVANGQYCVEEISSCLKYLFYDDSTGSIYDTYYNNINVSGNQIYLRCYLCDNMKMFSRTGVLFQFHYNECIPKTVIPSNCSQYDSTQSECKFCIENSILDLSNFSCSDHVAGPICSQYVSNCLECYSYQIGGTQIIQCVTCAAGRIATPQGCMQCKKGCDECYPIQNGINLFNEIYYQQKQFSSISDQQKTFSLQCKVCQPGYLLSKSQCIQQCGKYCSNCSLQPNGKYQCLECQISDITSSYEYELKALNQLFPQIPSILMAQLVTFTQDQLDCQICPYGCLICQRDSQITVYQKFNDIYKSTCYLCYTDAITINGQLYEWRLDRESNQCVLCLPDNLNCKHSIDVELTAKCDDYNGDTDIKLLDAGNLNWNQLILSSSSDLNELYMNQLMIYEINVILVISSSTCTFDNTNKVFRIENTVQAIYPNLKRINLLIRPHDPNNTINVLILQPIQIIGFHCVTLQKLNITPSATSSNVNFGLTIQNSSVYTIKLQEIKFQGSSPASSSLVIKISNLYDSFILIDVTIDSIIQSQTNLIQLTVDKEFDQTYFSQYSTSLGISNTNLILQNSQLTSLDFYDISQNNVVFNCESMSISACQFEKFNYLVQSDSMDLTLAIKSILITSINKDESILNSSILFKLIQSNTNLHSILTITIEQTQILSCSGLFQLTSVKSSEISLTNCDIVNSVIFLLKSSISMIQTSFPSISLLRLALKSMTFILCKSFDQLSILLFLISNNTGNSSTSQIIIDIEDVTKLSIGQDNDLSSIIQNSYITLISGQLVSDIKITNLNIDNSLETQPLHGIMSIQNIQQSLKFTSITAQNIISQVSLFSFLYTLNSQTNIQLTFTDINLNHNSLIMDENELRSTSLMLISGLNQQLTIVMDKINVHSNFYSYDMPITYIQSSVGIYISSINSKLTISNSDFQNNKSASTFPSITCLLKEIMIDTCTFSNDQPFTDIVMPPEKTNLLGGFIHIQAQTINIYSSTFTGGYASAGGAAYIAPLSTATVNIYGSSFIQNAANPAISTGLGGAIFFDFKNMNDGDITISQSVSLMRYFYKYNQASKGGVFYFTPTLNNINININDGEFQDNFAYVGGHIIYCQITEEGYDTNSIDIEPHTKIINTLFRQLQLVSQNIYFDNIRAVFIEPTPFIFTAVWSIVSNFDLGGFTTVKFSSSYFQLIYSKVMVFFIQTLELEFCIFDQNSKGILYGIAEKVIIKSTTIQNSYGQTIKIKSEQVIIDTLTFDFNENSSFYSGQLSPYKSNILIKSNQVTITNSSFDQNSNEEGSILCIYTDNSANNTKSSIDMSTFTSNFATPVKILNQGIIITLCTFDGNSGYHGGAISIMLDDYLNTAVILQNLLKISSSDFTNNSGYIGGAIEALQGQVSIDNSSVTFSGNSATIFGKNIAVLPNKFRLIDPKNQLTSKVTKLEPSFKFDVQLVLLTEFDEIFLFDEFENWIPIPQLSISFLYLSSHPGPADFSNFILNYSLPINQFDLSDTTIFSYENTYGLLQLSSPSTILVPQRDNNGLLTGISYNYIFEIELSFFGCKVGETLIQGTIDSHQYCKVCEKGTYNFDGGECKQCPIEQAICFGSTIQLPKGYWRSSLTSIEIIKCTSRIENCVGDFPSTDLQKIQNNQQLKFPSKYCQQGIYSNIHYNLYQFTQVPIILFGLGYIGAQCEDCDTTGQTWGASFVKNGNFQCVECSDVGQTQVKLSFILFGTCISSFLTVFSILDYGRQGILQKYQSLMGKHGMMKINISFIEYQEPSIFVKIILNYLSILSVISTLGLQLPDNINSVLITFGSPITTSGYQLDCLFHKIKSNTPYVYMRVVYLQLIIVITSSLITLFVLLSSLIIKEKFKARVVVSSIVILLFSNQPQSFSVLISTVFQYFINQLITCIWKFFWKNIGGQDYLKEYTSIEVNDNHFFYSKILLLPIFIFWVAVIIFFIVLLYRKRNTAFIKDFPPYEKVDFYGQNKQLQEQNIKVNQLIKQDNESFLLTKTQIKEKDILILGFYRKYTNHLDKISNITQYGFLYNEYDHRAYYWEIVKQVQKILIQSILTIFSQDVKSKCILIQFVIVIYLVVFVKIKPYKRFFLNSIDVLQSFICITSIGLALLMYNNSNDFLSKLSFYLIIFINSAFFSFLLYQCLRSVFYQQKRIIKPYYKRFKKKYQEYKKRKSDEKKQKNNQDNNNNKNELDKSIYDPCINLEMGEQNEKNVPYYPLADQIQSNIPQQTNSKPKKIKKKKPYYNWKKLSLAILSSNLLNKNKYLEHQDILFQKFNPSLLKKVDASIEFSQSKNDSYEIEKKEDIPSPSTPKKYKMSSLFNKKSIIFREPQPAFLQKNRTLSIVNEENKDAAQDDNQKLIPQSPQSNSPKGDKKKIQELEDFIKRILNPCDSEEIIREIRRNDKQQVENISQFDSQGLRNESNSNISSPHQQIDDGFVKNNYLSFNNHLNLQSSKDEFGIPKENKSLMQQLSVRNKQNILSPKQKEELSQNIAALNFKFEHILKRLNPKSPEKEKISKIQRILKTVCCSDENEQPLQQLLDQVKEYIKSLSI